MNLVARILVTSSCVLGMLLIAAPCQLKAQTLLIHGGSSMGQSCDDAFLKAAGEQPRLVIIPTAKSKPNETDRITAAWKKVGFDQVTVLHTTRRDVANDEKFVEPLINATAVWISGGSQSRLSAAYTGTLVEKTLVDLSLRGVIIGGSSAGAAIQSKIMIASGRERPDLSNGFDLLPGTIVDQHFLARSRLNRLIAAVQKHPDKIGIGIDEKTSLIVNGNVGTVSGNSYVLTVRWTKNGIDVRSYEAGETIELPSRKKQ